MKKNTIKLAIYSIVMAIASSCGTDSPLNDPAAMVKPDALLLKRNVVADSTEIIEAAGERTYVKISWPEILPPENLVARNINGAIQRDILEMIASVNPPLTADKVMMPADINAAAKSFIQSYRVASTEYEEGTPWHLVAYVDTVYAGKTILTFMMGTSTYTGGMHSYIGDYCLHFDPKTGKQISIMEFFRDSTSLSTALEAKFRQMYKLAPGQDMIEGNLLEDYTGRFPITSEMYFDDNKLVAIYNPYDIQPFSEGQIIIELSNEEYIPLMKKPVKP